MYLRLVKRNKKAQKEQGQTATAAEISSRTYAPFLLIKFRPHPLDCMLHRSKISGACPRERIEINSISTPMILDAATVVQHMKNLPPVPEAQDEVYDSEDALYSSQIPQA